ncbi:hypothetical protein APHNP_0949 [Anaplasma phagocytophilum str. ApNP]|uniref:Uncharacterized protein n=1 Tax=Anaplasma phagocytophilum str. ApNP TaxID=1359153 RepID=A0A0F3NJN3_ANAPH|nr:hypothetical protein APHNP_0949 [Anaplasma phagocytophilum str. ApNP]
MTLALWILVVRDPKPTHYNNLFLSAFIACFGRSYSSPYVSY